MDAFEIGEKVEWQGVNRRETGEIEAKDERGIVICLGNGKAIIARKEFDERRKVRYGKAYYAIVQTIARAKVESPDCRI